MYPLKLPPCTACGFHSFYIFHSKNEFLFLKIKFWPLFRWLIWRWKLDCCQTARTEKKTLIWNKFLNKLIRISFWETQLSYLKAAAHYLTVQCIFTKNKQLGIPKNYRLDRKINDTALWYGGIGSCANFVKFSMSPNGLFGISTLNLISGGPYGTINFYVMLHLGPI